MEYHLYKKDGTYKKIIGGLDLKIYKNTFDEYLGPENNEEENQAFIYKYIVTRLSVN